MTTQSINRTAYEIAHGLVSMSPDAQISAKKRFTLAIELLDSEPQRLHFSIEVARLAELIKRREGERS